MSSTFPSARADALVLFGITGDLGKSKLIPAIVELCRNGRLDGVPVIGVGRRQRSDREIQDLVAAATDATDADVVDRLDLRYVSGDATDHRTFDEIADILEHASRPVVYAALPPAVFGEAAQAIAASRMPSETRFVVEKPFGTDARTACELHDQLTELLGEHGLLVVDHFLAKASVENLLTVRTSNALFDHVLDRHSVERIEIELRERGDVSDRGSFYEQVGVVDDVVQNHLIQLAALALMERPVDDSDEAYHDARASLIESMSVLTDSVVLGQYEGYREHDDVADDSQVATFCSFTMTVDTDRWRGVPVEVVTGKALDETSTAVTFVLDGPGTNSIRFGIKPDPTITIGLDILDAEHQSPGGPSLRRADARLCGPSEHGELGDYATLLDDALDQSGRHFAQIDDIVAGWRIVSGITVSDPELCMYERGSSGPVER
jgi:glucose-6-phosphate 1-dehydrogenase